MKHKIGPLVRRPFWMNLEPAPCSSKGEGRLCRIGLLWGNKMKLVSVEASRIVSLVHLRASRGQPFAPDVLLGAVARYRFQIAPQSAAELAAESVTLKMGVFEGVQINELAVYNDGLIVNVRANAKLAEDFLDDVYGWAASEFGLAKIEQPGEMRHFESSVVVEMATQVADKFNFLNGLYEDLTGFQEAYGVGNLPYRFGGFQAETEGAAIGGKRTFTFQRRLNTPFAANYWFSSAPLRTDDHLSVLEELERRAL